jgi:hypothetical protein
MRRATLTDRLVHKLHPDRVKTSGKFAAILACVLEQEWTSPGLAGITVTSDGFLLGREEGDIGHNVMLGRVEDLHRNLTGIADATGLTKTERQKLFKMCSLAIERG